MKKIFAILVTICLLASAFCINAFAALLNGEPTPMGNVLTVSALKKDGTSDKIDDYQSFVVGWNAAIKTALTNYYDRVVGDFHADWVATGGEFCDDGIGFSYDAIYIPENARLTLMLMEFSLIVRMKKLHLKKSMLKKQKCFLIVVWQRAE